MAERNSSSVPLSHNASIPPPRREGKPDVNSIASQYLRELLTGVSLKRSDLVVEHVCLSHDIQPEAASITAAEFLERCKAEFNSLSELEHERINVEETRVILASGGKFFLGFLRGSRVVFGYNPRLALELSVEQADKIQPALALLGYETTQQPPRKTEASF
jgi:hypothetical protein